MKYLITGGCGFVGSNLALEVLRRDEELIILDNLFRTGSSSNLETLKKKGKFKFHLSDIRNKEDVSKIIENEKPDYVFHLAGQVAMTTSIDNPILDFEVNVLGTLNVLEAIREFSPKSILLYSSTNKVYGDFADLTFYETETRYLCKEFPDGFNEQTQIDFHSPYGCSKGSADQYILDYSRIFGLKTAVFRHSSMYGGNQHPTYDQGWIGWFTLKALEIKKGVLKEPLSISGTGKQVRDVLHSDDVVELYFKTIEKISNANGQAFNIGGGRENSLSLIELFRFFEANLDISIKYKQLSWRESDQKVFIADNSKVSTLINWSPKISTNKGLIRMINWLEKEHNLI